MLKILFDQNFNHRILRGLRKRIPDLDALTTQVIKKERDADLKLLQWALEKRRVVITHDRKTFPKYTYEQLVRGKKTYGVIIVPTALNIGKAIDDLEFLIKFSSEDEFVNQVKHLPLRPFI